MLFHLPHPVILSTPFITVNTLILFYLKGDILLLTIYLIYLFTSLLLIYMLFYNIVLTANRVNRLIGLYTYLILPTIVILIVIYILTNTILYVIHTLLIVPAVLSYFLYRALNYTETPYKPVVYIILAIMLTIYVISEVSIFMYTVLSVVTSILIIELYLYRISRLGEPLFNSMVMFSAFINLWLNNNPKSLENELNNIAVKSSGWVKVLKILDENSGKPYLTVVIPSFHCGPFRNVGGSSLVKRISEVVNRILNTDVIVLHSPSEHSLDPVSKLDVDRIVSKVCESLLSSINGVNVEFYNVENYNLKYYDIVVLQSPQVPLVIISGKEGYGIDDLPIQVYYKLRDRLKCKLGVKDVIVIEGHNWISKFKVNHNIPLNSIIDEIGYILEIKTSSPVKLLRLGYGVDKTLSHNIDICELGVSVLLLEYSDKVFSLVVVDGNNMKEGFRYTINNSIRNYLRKRFNSKDIIVETVTTDNHSKTGIEAGIKRGYRVVGEYTDLNSLLKSIKIALDKALTSMIKPKIEYYNVTVTDVNVLGYRNYLTLLKILDRAVKFVSRTILPLHILIYSTIFLPLIVSFKLI